MGAPAASAGSTPCTPFASPYIAPMQQPNNSDKHERLVQVLGLAFVVLMLVLFRERF